MSTFVHGLLWLWRQNLLTRHNVRALWLQARGAPDWVGAFDDLTDEEWCDYIEAIS